MEFHQSGSFPAKQNGVARAADSPAEAIGKVLSQGAAAEDGIAEGQAERTNRPAAVQALNEAGIADPIYPAEGLEITAATWDLLRAVQLAENPPDSLLVLQRNSHHQAPLNQGRLHLYKA